jgi:hypothetical protein
MLKINALRNSVTRFLRKNFLMDQFPLCPCHFVSILKLFSENLARYLRLLVQHTNTCYVNTSEESQWSLNDTTSGLNYTSEQNWPGLLYVASLASMTLLINSLLASCLIGVNKNRHNWSLPYQYQQQGQCCWYQPVKSQKSPQTSL